MDFEGAMRDALVLARDAGADVFNCLPIQHNERVLKELRFGRGDGTLHFYLYNWRAPDMPSRSMGITLI